jgi:hypothetical protein
MNLIQSCVLPEGAMLSRYAQSGTYTDCYFMDMPMKIGLSEYIKSIYTTPLFKIERGILALIARRPSTDLGAEELANNKTKQFAAWSVEDRGANQMLLCDFMGRTRSWLIRLLKYRFWGDSLKILTSQNALQAIFLAWVRG